MKHGIGSEAQRRILIAGGADRVWSLEEIEDVLSTPDIAVCAWRSGDAFIMVQPKLITSAIMSRLVRYVPTFEMLGHSPMDCSNPETMRAFRGLVPMDDATLEPRKGGNVKYRQPTHEEITVMVSYWHGTMKPREFMPLIRNMMGEPDLPNTWVRDRIRDATGNTKRDPNAPGKRPFVPNTKEAD